MPRINATAIGGLPEATNNAQLVEAHLIDYNKESNRLWTFFYNPSSLNFKREAVYSQTETYAAKVQDSQYSHTTGKSLDISGIYLDSYCLGKSLKPLIDGINALLEAKTEKKEFAPPLLSFVMGARRFGPCVLTRVDWTESAWLGGEPARVQMNITLIEVPKPGRTITQAAEIPRAAEDPKKGDGKPRIALTDRQREDARKKAVEYLNSNVSSFDTKTQNLIRSKNYALTTDPNTGDVTLFDNKKNKVGVIGRWDGTTFKTEGVSTLPKKTGASSGFSAGASA